MREDGTNEGGGDAPELTTRRSAIKKAAVAGGAAGIVWVAPTVLSREVAVAASGGGGGNQPIELLAGGEGFAGPFGIDPWTTDSDPAVAMQTHDYPDNPPGPGYLFTGPDTPASPDGPVSMFYPPIDVGSHGALTNASTLTFSAAAASDEAGQSSKVIVRFYKASGVTPADELAPPWTINIQQPLITATSISLAPYIGGPLQQVTIEVRFENYVNQATQYINGMSLQLTV